MTQFGSQVQTAVHVRLASAAALDTCTYSSASSVLPSNTDLGAKLVATSNGALTIDGVAAAVDDEVLIKDQVATLQNGVYRVRNIGGTSSTWSLERSKQARDSGQFDGMLVSTGPSGSANPSAVFLYSGGTNPVIGTDAITFAALAAVSGTATTQPVGTDNTTIATTAFVNLEIPYYVVASSPVVTITTGNETDMAPTTVISNFLLISAGALLAYTIKIANGLYDGQVVFVTFNNAITTLTLGGTNFGTTGLTQPTATTGAVCFGWVWYPATSKWVRFQ